MSIGMYLDQTYSRVLNTRVERLSIFGFFPPPPELIKTPPTPWPGD